MSDLFIASHCKRFEMEILTNTTVESVVMYLDGLSLTGLTYQVFKPEDELKVSRYNTVLYNISYSERTALLC